MLLNYDPVMRERLKPYDVKGKGEMEWKEFYVICEEAIRTSSIGGDYSGECIRYCKNHGECPHFSSDLYCILCNDEKKPVQVLPYETDIPIEDSLPEEEEQINTKINLDMVIGRKTHGQRIYKFSNISSLYKKSPKPPKTSIRPATSNVVKKEVKLHKRGYSAGYNRNIIKENSITSCNSDTDDFINAKNALDIMEEITIKQEELLKEKNAKPVWHVTPLSPIESPEINNNNNNKKIEEETELDALSAFGIIINIFIDSDDEIKLDNKNSKLEDGEEEEEENELDTSEEYFEISPHSDKDGSLFNKISPRRGDLINKAILETLKLYIKHDKINKVKSLIKEKNIKLNDIENNDCEYTLIQLAINNVL